MEYGMNLTYHELTKTNPLLKKLYETNADADKQIKKALGRKYKSREQNSVDAILIYHKAVEALPVHLEAIKKSYENKVADKRKEFIKPTDGNLVDARLAIEYLRGLSTFERLDALKDQPELRNLADRHKSVFGVPESDVEIFQDMETLFFDMYRDDLQVEKESYNALQDLEKSFKHTLTLPFESMADAEALLQNFMESEGEESTEGKEVA